MTFWETIKFWFYLIAGLYMVLALMWQAIKEIGKWFISKNENRL